MTTTDYGTVFGLFLAAWATGYTTGYIFKAIRRTFEIVTGGSG